MKHFLFLLILIVTFLVSESCKKANFCDCIKRSGEIDTVQIYFEKIYSLEVYKMFNIYIIQDTINKAVIETNKNLLDLIEITKDDSLLIVTDNNICNFTRSYENEINVYLHLTNLREIFLWGPSKINSIDTLTFKHLLIRVYDDIGDVNLTIVNDHVWLEYWFATGNATLHGSTTFFEILTHGYAYIHAYDFRSRYVSINQNCTGDTEVYPLDEIKVKINDIGNIYYKGNPYLINILENNSSGELIHVE
jgi:hypothetical protein